MSPVHTFPTEISLTNILCFDLIIIILINNNNNNFILLLLVLLVNYKVTMIITCGKVQYIINK
jgi:hypothetical protein